MFNLKSFVLNRRFLAEPKRVNSLWSLGLSKTFLLICLLVITGGVNLRVSAADITYKLLGAGDAIKTDGTKYAIQFYKLYSSSHDFTNSFLGNLGVYSNSTYVITLATKATGGTSVTDIETIIDESKTEYLFTFEKNAKGETKISV